MNKKLLFTLTCCLCSSLLFAQPKSGTPPAGGYKNEWINYSNTYYKFMIGPFGWDSVGAPITNGVVRIPASALAASGLGSTPANQFQLWHNGAQVPLYTSVQTGVFGPNDYIEFWGAINDGTLDKYLYPDPSYQVSTHWSMQADSAAYYLTTSASGVNERYVPTPNNTSGATIPADKNFMYTQGRYYHTQINPGYGVVVDGFTLYSSQYDVGEMWTSRGVDTTYPVPEYFTSLYLDTSGPAMTARVAALGGAPNPRHVQVNLNNTLLGVTELDNFADSIITTTNIPANTIGGDEASFYMEDITSGPSDVIYFSFVELEYPRLFNFGNNSSFAFNLAPSAKGRLIHITNFSSDVSAPVLYDMANGTRYVADVSVPGTVSFLLTPSTQTYQLVLVRGDGSTATVINTLQQRNFVPFSQKANQGNYLIISNPTIYGSGSSNYVEQYREYRSSTTGGGYNAKTIDINEITDQFAWGVKKDPLAVSDFLLYARNNFRPVPAFAFFIGKGVTYDNYEPNETDPLDDELDLVPTWGYPGSDNLLSGNNYSPIPATPIGRLSAVSAEEVGVYLAKVKQYEAAQMDTTQTLANKGWMKTVLQLTGADDPSIGPELDGYMAAYKKIISDTLFGGNVISFSKSADPAAYPQEVVNFTNIYNSGSGLISYFGHSSETSLDFNLGNPDSYNNTGKYPMFIVNGCLAGNIFDFDVDRLNEPTTISEKFILAPSEGAVGYLATTSFGITNYLNIFTTKFYDGIARKEYGKGFGDVMQYGITQGLNVTGSTDFYGTIQADQYTFHGDPAVKMNSYSKPDYVIDSSQVIISPSYLSIGDDSFNVKIRIYNIGRAIPDSVHLLVTRQYPNGASATVLSTWIKNIYSLDSVSLNLPIVADRDAGTGYITATINDLNTVSELTLANNTGRASYTINNTDIRPIYPYNYSIVTKHSLTLFASTENPLAPSTQYVMQLDTTALFNSPSLQIQNVTSTGGVLSFNVSLPHDSTVYYWRVARAAKPQYWYGFSFTYNSKDSVGFAQDHFYQNTRSSLNGLLLDSVSRKYKFSQGLTNVFVQQTIYPTGGDEDNQFSVSVNGSFISESACVGSSIIFNVFDTLTFNPWSNTTDPFGAASPCLPDRRLNFEYSTLSSNWRDSAVQFFNSIPNGDYVIAREIYNLGDADFASVWASDTLLYGSGNSLYNVFKSQGLPIDSFDYPRTFIFLFRKNDATHFQPLSVFTLGVYDAITLSQNINTRDTSGIIMSPKIGPALAWSSMLWNGYVPDSYNNTTVNIIGIKNNGTQKVLDTLSLGQQSFNISSINAGTYPYLQLQLNTQDSTAFPYQLQNWSVQYSPAPEGGLAPNLGISIPDTVSYKEASGVGYDTLSGYVVFKNVSPVKFNPLYLRVILYDSLNNADTFVLPKTKVLHAGGYASYCV